MISIKTTDNENQIYKNIPYIITQIMTIEETRIIILKDMFVNFI